MRFETGPAPHIAPATSVPWLMIQVLLALAPAIALYTGLFGVGVLCNLALATGVCLGAEAMVLRLRGRPIRPVLGDGSAAVTGFILALALPPLCPWWVTASGAVFAIVFAKHLYGGLGTNPFNPAMAGYVLLLVAFPIYLTRWPSPPGLAEAWPGLLGTLQYLLTGTLPAALSIDAVTGATPLDVYKTRLTLSYTWPEIQTEPIFGLLGGRGWQWINLAYLGGGLYLLARGVINWRIPLAMLAMLAVLAGFFHLLDPGRFAGPLFHIFGGAAIFGAFFVATDPVSSATTPVGQLLFGAGVGALVYLIRTFGGYPDAVAFSVLLMNMAAPAIDRYTQPRVYGHDR